MISRIQLKRFKKFKSLSVDFSPFTVLMGENSCGKTSVLQALNLAHVALYTTPFITVDNQGKVKIRPKGVGLTKLPGIDLSDFRELYFGKRSRASRTEKWTGTSIELQDGNGNLYKLQVTSLFGGFNVKCISQPQDFKSSPQLQRKPPLLISGFVGLTPTEERVFPVALIDRLRSGHVSSVIRNLIFDTKHNAPQKYESLKKRLMRDFGFYLDSVLFDEKSDLYVTAQYSEPCEDKNLSLDFNASGSGFMQVLQILAPIYRFCPENSEVVLLDEPDAHLHPNLQTTLANSLRKIRDELNIQIIISTHSTAIIRSASASEVIPVSAHTTKCRPLTTRKDVEENIKSKIDSYNLAKSVISGKLVFFEDTDLSVWEQVDDVLGTRIFKGASTVPIIRGRGKTDRVPFQIKRILEELFYENIDVIFVRDGDGILPEWRSKLLRYATSRDVALHILEYFELESYLLFPNIIIRALQKKFPDSVLPTPNDLEEKIVSALKETITLARFNYDDCLEEELHQAGRLMNLDEYRNYLDVKSVVREWHTQLETLSNIDDLRKYGQGKQAFSTILNWLNNDLKYKISKGEIIQEIRSEETAPNLMAVLSSLISKEARCSPEPMQPMQEDNEQDEVELKVEQLLFDTDEVDTNQVNRAKSDRQQLSFPFNDN